MSDPLNNFGLRFLNASLESEQPTSRLATGISRRAFLALTATLASCRAATPLNEEIAATTRKSPSNSNYITPSLTGPSPRNPDQNLSSTFNKGPRHSYSRVMVSGNYVAMTFDDGPHPQNTPRLLNILRTRNIKATFFVVGNCVDAYPNIVQQTIAEGHEIGNHSYNHKLLSKLSDSEIRHELTRCHEAVKRASGVDMRVMRPPYGGLNERQRTWVMSEFGYPTILWNVDPLDWKKPGASVVTSRILSGANNGSIILAHDLHAATVDAMPATLDGLLRKGFQFVTVSQLLAMAPATPNA